MDHEGWGCAEGDDIRQRIELPAERAFVAAEAGDPAIEEVEDAGEDDEEDGVADAVGEVRGGEVGFDDFGEGEEAAEEISGGEEVGEEVDFQLGRFRRGCGLTFAGDCRGGCHGVGRVARTVMPPWTRCLSWT